MAGRGGSRCGVSKDTLAILGVTFSESKTYDNIYLMEIPVKFWNQTIYSDYVIIYTGSIGNGSTMGAAAANAMRADSTRDGGAWDMKTFSDLSALIGSETASQIVRRFWSDLCGRFVDTTVRDVLRRDAEAVAATSVILGFKELSKAASALAVACDVEASTDVCLHTLMMARLRASRALLRSITPPSKPAVVALPYRGTQS